MCIPFANGGTQKWGEMPAVIASEKNNNFAQSLTNSFVVLHLKRDRSACVKNSKKKKMLEKEVKMLHIFLLLL